MICDNGKPHQQTHQCYAWVCNSPICTPQCHNGQRHKQTDGCTVEPCAAKHCSYKRLSVHAQSHRKAACLHCHQWFSVKAIQQHTQTCTGNPGNALNILLPNDEWEIRLTEFLLFAEEAPPGTTLIMNSKIGPAFMRPEAACLHATNPEDTTVLIPQSRIPELKGAARLRRLDPHEIKPEPKPEPKPCTGIRLEGYENII